MDNQEKKQFRLFIEEIKKYDIIPLDLVNVLISRYIAPLRKKGINPYGKLRYYSSYWFKILIKNGILVPKGMGYKVIKVIK